MVRSGLRALTRVWRGDTSWAGALRTGDVVLVGPAEARRELPAWIGQSDLARVPRP
ncbi:MAG: hypothetical protein ACTHNI_11780 [Cellulosimicrobium cellulans]